MVNARIVFSSISQVKKHALALAILFYIGYYKKRACSDIKKDLELDDEKGNNLILALDKGIFIRPNPHRNVDDINYVLAEKGVFLIEELTERNPALSKFFESVN